MSKSCYTNCMLHGQGMSGLISHSALSSWHGAWQSLRFHNWMCFIAQSNFLGRHGLYPARHLGPWGFSRQEYWSGLPCPPEGDLPDPGVESRSPALHVVSLPAELPGKPNKQMNGCISPSVVQSLSHVLLFATPQTKHASLPCPSLSPGVKIVFIIITPCLIKTG